MTDHVELLRRAVPYLDRALDFSSGAFHAKGRLLYTQITDALRESEPIDPLLVEARDVVAKHYDDQGAERSANLARKGELDRVPLMEIAYAAVKHVRGAA